MAASSVNPFEDDYDTATFGSEPESSDKGLTLGKHQNVVQLVNNLRAVGAQLEVDLPSIALCGQQSCGKSSLTEAICGVAMPRNAGTCTRCPTELRLIQSDGDFKCDVGIRFEYDDVELCPLPTVREQNVGSTSVRSQVAGIVTRAQHQILDAAGLQFSRNVITVTICEPNCLNLTILDLPGLIFSIEKNEDARFIDLVRGLIVDTITKPNTLIACVISCKDDMENQAIIQLARDADLTGSRTIGVLTKVDTIETGLEAPWISVLRNEKYPLKLGYVAVKNPNQSELRRNLSYSEARALEEEQFARTPWNTLSATIQNRFGAKSLMRILSDTLGALIGQRLPSMRVVIEDKLMAVKEELKELPPAPHSCDQSPTEVTFTALTKFCDELKHFIRINDSDFWEDEMNEFTRFQNDLDRIKPRFASGNKAAEAQSDTKLLYSMQDVLKQKRKNRRRGMGCARKHFVQNSMNKWENYTRQTVEACSEVFSRHMRSVAKQTLLPYRTLHSLGCAAALELLEEVTANANAEIAKVLQRELKMEFTLSSVRLHTTYSNALDQLCAAFSVEKKNEAQFDENEAVMIMANAIAYYDLAFRRFADATAMCVEDIMFNGFAQKIDAKIRNRLQLFDTDENRMEAWLDEDSEVAEKRKVAMFRFDRLQQIAKELRMVIAEPDGDDTGLALSAAPSPKTLSATSSDLHYSQDEKSDEQKSPKKKKKVFGLF